MMPRRSARPFLAAGAPAGGGQQLHRLVFPAYDQAIKASHVFNLLDARGVISVTERQSYILRVRNLAKACGEAFLLTEAGGFPDAALLALRNGPTLPAALENK